MNSVKIEKRDLISAKKKKEQREKKASNRLQNYCGETGMIGKYKMLQKTQKSTKPGLRVVISLLTISEEKRQRVRSVYFHSQQALCAEQMPAYVLIRNTQLKVLGWNQLQ